MTTTTFNPSRLALARRRRGLTKVALGHAVGLTARRIAAFENEGEAPPEATVKALADVLAFPVGFFYRPNPPELSPEGVSFRSFSRLSAGRRDAALAAAALAIEVAHWIDEHFQLPAPDVPDLRDVEPETAASVLRTEWGLGNDPASNIIHLLEAHGVRVYSLVDDCADLDAFSLWSNGVPYVFLTLHKSPERSRWDATHELGHLVLHLDAPPQGRQQEQDADSFTAEFLLPERGVRSTAAPYPSLPDVRREKVKWRVSALAYIRSLHRLDLLTEWQYRSLVVEASQAGYRREEGDIDREVSQLIPKVLGMLAQDGVSPALIASELQVSVNELRGLLFSPLSLITGEGKGVSARQVRHLRVV